MLLNNGVNTAPATRVGVRGASKLDYSTRCHCEWYAAGWLLDCCPQSQAICANVANMCKKLLTLETMFWYNDLASKQAQCELAG